MLQTRKRVVCVCIAFVVFAALVPAVWGPFPAVLTPLWLVVPALSALAASRRADRRAEQPVSLLSVILSRAPPIRLTLS
jgi:hypothetical protein